MAKYKGGYQIVSLLGVLVSASLSGTFNAKEMLTKIKGSNLKRIVLTDLVVNGEKKNDIEVQYELDETNKTIVLKGIYGYQITIDYSTSVTSAGITGALMPDAVGTKLYKHTFKLASNSNLYDINIINNSSTPLSDLIGISQSLQSSMSVNITITGTRNILLNASYIGTAILLDLISKNVADSSLILDNVSCTLPSGFVDTITAL